MTEINTAELIAEIRSAHRRRRFAMKTQQKLDRALESFIRVNATEWRPDMPEKDREKINAAVKKIIKDNRDSGGDLADMIQMNDEARAPADKRRKINEKQMEQLAEQLPVYAWAESVRGIGALGLATIVAEAGDISNYPNVAKLWKRLGYAPYDGYAGSSWKREPWRPRALTKEEWIANPFSGERYGLMFQIALWLRNAQWIGKAKSEDGVGKPNGRYGEVYAARRNRTKVTHPDWSDTHGDKDALRVMMKELLKDLWVEWHKADRSNRPTTSCLKSSATVSGVNSTAGQISSDAQITCAGRPTTHAVESSGTLSGVNSGGAKC